MVFELTSCRRPFFVRRQDLCISSESAWKRSQRVSPVEMIGWSPNLGVFWFLSHFVIALKIPIFVHVYKNTHSINLTDHFGTDLPIKLGILKKFRPEVPTCAVQAAECLAVLGAFARLQEIKTTWLEF